jgi:hypothetical protein
METRRFVEFTGVELPASVEKAVIGPVEKATVGCFGREDGPQWAATMGRRRHGEGERRAALLGCGGDAGCRVERRGGGAAERCCGAAVESLLERTSGQENMMLGCWVRCKHFRFFICMLPSDSSWGVGPKPSIFESLGKRIQTCSEGLFN